MKKYSIAALILLVTVAIKVAFASSKAASSNAAVNGIMSLSTGEGNCNPADATCRERLSSDVQSNCSYTNTAPGPGSFTNIGACSHSISIAYDSASDTTDEGID